MKGLFIPEITAEMFRNGCLEGIEALMAEGEIYDIDYTGWIPVSERLPSEDGHYLVCMAWEYDNVEVLKWADGWNCYRNYDGKVDREHEIGGADIIAWMPLPKPYREDGEEE